jgi:tetratricopeptide (TPR) repeat protein
MATAVIKCKYFPALPARWHCPNCEVDMANECAKISPNAVDKKVCPICLTLLESLGIANSIRPFWERIPKFFAYPAKPYTLLYIGILSLSVFAAIFMPLLGLFIVLGAFFGILKYAYKCLNHAAGGYLSPPGIGGFKENDKQHPFIIFKQFCVFVFIAFIISISAGFGKFIGVAVMLFSLLSLPAIIMLLAMTGSFSEAINPLKTIQIMTGMGKSYFILYLFLLLLGGSNQLVQYWAINLVSPLILFPTIFFINSYFLIAIFSMLGYALYQYHEKLGFRRVIEVNLAEEGIDIKASGINQDPFLNEIHILVAEGLIEEAIKRFKKLFAQGEQPLNYHDKYHTLLKLANNTEQLVQHTTEYMTLLLRQPKVNKGTLIGLCADCIKIAPDYFYPDAKVTVDLAKTAFELFRYNDATILLNKFAQNYPNSDQIPYAYFIAAQVLVDYKQQEAQAKKILQSLLVKYPNHDGSSGFPVKLSKF